MFPAVAPHLMGQLQQWQGPAGMTRNMKASLLLAVNHWGVTVTHCHYHQAMASVTVEAEEPLVGPAQEQAEVTQYPYHQGAV